MVKLANITATVAAKLSAHKLIELRDAVSAMDLARSTAETRRALEVLEAELADL